jgi:hypothetical protein
LDRSLDRFKENFHTEETENGDWEGKRLRIAEFDYCAIAKGFEFDLEAIADFELRNSTMVTPLSLPSLNFLCSVVP